MMTTTGEKTLELVQIRCKRRFPPHLIFDRQIRGDRTLMLSNPLNEDPFLTGDRRITFFRKFGVYTNFNLIEPGDSATRSASAPYHQHVNAHDSRFWQAFRTIISR